MDNKYSEFSDFLKKKLKEAERKNNDWDKPEGVVKEKLLQHISDVVTTTPASVTKPLFAANKLVYMALVSAALLVWGGYTFHLYTKNVDLKTTLTNKSIALDCETLEDTKQKHANEIATLLQENKIVNNAKTIVYEENTSLKQQLEKQENVLSQLNKEIQSLYSFNKKNDLKEELNHHHLIKNINDLNEQLQERQNRIAHLEWLYQNLKLLQERTYESNVNLLKQNVPYYKYCVQKEEAGLPLQPITPRLSTLPDELTGLPKYQSVFPTFITQLKRKRFEFGYSYSFSKPDIVIENSLQNPAGFSQTAYGYGDYKNHGFSGFSVGYSPRQKFWIKTGIHLNKQVVSNYFGTSVKYFNLKEGEIYTTSNIVENRLSFLTKTEYAETTNPISIEFNRNKLSANDDMDFQIKSKQQLNYLRIPLSVERYFGKKRIQGFISGGFQLTRITGNQTIEADVQSNKVEIETSYSNQSQNIKPIHFMNFYGGLGINYRIVANLHARASISLHNKFIKNYIYTTNKEFDLDIGLYYQF